MSVERGLLEDIRDHPDDDGPRLICADWLEDRGDAERAELIRVQIERARLPLEDDRHAELEARERRLLLKHADRWAPGELPLSWTAFRRGFPELLIAPPSWLTDEQIADLGPLPLRELRLDGQYGELDTGRLRELELLDRIETLRLGGALSPLYGPDIRELLESERLGRLRRLDLSGNRLDDYQLARILDLPAVRLVEELELGSNAISDAGFGHLLRAPWPNLRRLNIRFNSCADSFEAFLGSELWRRLEAIVVDWPCAGPARPLHVEAIEQMRARSLHVLPNGGTSFVTALCEATRWGPLEDLTLMAAELESEQFSRFLAHPALGGLRQLELVDCGLEPAAVSLLASCPRLANLNRLGIDVACGPLARSGHLEGLTHLRAGGGEDDVVAFVESPNASHLRWLRIDTFTDRIAAALAGSPHMSRLTTLRAGAPLSDEAAELLAASPYLKNLTFLSLNTERLSARGLQALLRAEHLGWVGIRQHQAMDADSRRLWRQRYGDGERVALITGVWPGLVGL